jgi:hypothetical protein
MERISNCCQVVMGDIVLEMLICPDCKEHCSADTYCTDCCNEEMTEKQFIEQSGICSMCARMAKE